MDNYKVLYKFYVEHTKVTGKMLDNAMRQYVRKSAIAEDPQGIGCAAWMGVDWLRLEGIIELMSKIDAERASHESMHERAMQRLAVQKVKCEKLRKLCKENNIDISNV